MGNTEASREPNFRTWRRPRMAPTPARGLTGREPASTIPSRDAVPSEGDPGGGRRRPATRPRGGFAMPLFEVETTSHIMIACVDDEPAARGFASQNYPGEEVLRVSHRPRDAWVISKTLLGIGGQGRPLRQGPRLPGPGPGRQAPRRPPLHAADRHRPGRGPQGHRVEHGDGLVRRRPPSLAPVSDCDRPSRSTPGGAVSRLRRNSIGPTRPGVSPNVGRRSAPGGVMPKVICLILGGGAGPGSSR